IKHEHTSPILRTQRAKTCGARLPSAAPPTACLLPLRPEVLYPTREFRWEAESSDRRSESEIVPLWCEHADCAFSPELVYGWLVNHSPLLHYARVHLVHVWSVKVEDNSSAQRVVNHLLPKLAVIVMAVQRFLDIAKDNPRALPNLTPPHTSELDRPIRPACTKLPRGTASTLNLTSSVYSDLENLSEAELMQ